MGPLPPALAVHTTGVGDGFNGAYLAARLCATAVTEAVVRAQRVSAAAVRQYRTLIAAAALRVAA